MTFGKKIRELRQEKKLTLRDLAARVGVGFTYLSKIENQKLEEGHGPSEKLIAKLASELDTSEEELMLLAEKVPEPVRRRVLERPDIFLALSEFDDAELEAVFRLVEAKRANG